MKRELALYGFEIESIDFHPNAFYTPSPDLDGAASASSLLFCVWQKERYGVLILMTIIAAFINAYYSMDAMCIAGGVPVKI